jgi:uroporphyrinogen-III decarboxylase
MNSRERTKRAIERQNPDRVPAYFIVFPSARQKIGAALDALWARYPPDIVTFGHASEEEFSGQAGVPATDRWGAVWTSASADFKGQVTVHPLSDWSALPDYPWPQPLGWPEFQRAQAFLEQDGGEHYVLADGDTLFQRMMYLRGIEPLLIDLARGRDELVELRERICAYMSARIQRWIELGVDGIYFRDDWGSQNSLLINPRLWRSFFKPAYARLFAAVHAGEAHVFFHSDGMIASILPDLLEIGADVVHPQMPLLGAEYLAANYGGRLSFMCDPDRQTVLPFGTPQDVAAHVRHTLDALGRFGGGVIGWGEIAPDVPLDNAEAMVRTFAEWE